MKKLLGLLVLSAIFSWAGSASAEVPLIVTNSVQDVNFTLTFVSQLATNTTYTTNFTRTDGKITATNITTNVTFTVSRKSIATKDVISTILGSNAPVGATFVRVKNGANADTFEIRFKTTRVAVANFDLTEVASVMVRGTKEKDGNLLAGSGTDYSLRGFALTNTPLSFRVLGATDFTYVTAVLGKYSMVVGNLSASVVGHGVDSIGANELVTGTITITGPVLKVEPEL